MKKTILLMNTTLGTGGISASMINTANELSKEYDVSIFCFLPDGALKNRLKSGVKVIGSSWRLEALCLTIQDAKKRGIKYFLFKAFAHIWSILFTNRFPIYLAIKHQKKLGTFDLACSYTHESSKRIEYTGLIRVLLKKVDSKTKLSWVHCDYSKLPKSKFNNRYFNKCSAIVGCSSSVANVFKECHPQVTTKIDYCYNMIDYDMVFSKCLEKCDIKFNDNGIVCFSACRLTKIKAVDRMIESCAEIFKKNNAFWYIAGDGPEKNNIIELIKKHNLEDRVILLGEQTNPFKYIKNSDLYLSVSYEEAAPLVYFEAKALHVPVFSTRTLSTEELLNKDVDFICENDANSIAIAFDSATSSKKELEDRKEKLNSYVGNNNQPFSFFKKYLG